MFLQVIDEYPFDYMVKIDPVQDQIIYEDLLQFEKCMIAIEMNHHEPESLYAMYEGNVVRLERHVAWLEFCHKISTLVCLLLLTLKLYRRILKVELVRSQESI